MIESRLFLQPKPSEFFFFKGLFKNLMWIVHRKRLSITVINYGVIN